MGDEQKTIEELEAQLNALREENKKLNETIAWMHDLIWEMIQKQKS